MTKSLITKAVNISIAPDDPSNSIVVTLSFCVNTVHAENIIHAQDTHLAKGLYYKNMIGYMEDYLW